MSAVTRIIVAVCLPVLLFFGTAQAASAEVLSLSAASFPNGIWQSGVVMSGITVPLRANVTFPVSVRICGLRLTFTDNYPDGDVTAKLLRKDVSLTASAFDAPITIATVSSSGASDLEQTVTTRAVSDRVVDVTNSFYYVEVTGLRWALQYGDEFSVGLVGAQIEYRIGRVC